MLQAVRDTENQKRMVLIEKRNRAQRKEQRHTESWIKKTALAVALRIADSRTDRGTEKLDRTTATFSLDQERELVDLIKSYCEEDGLSVNLRVETQNNPLYYAKKASSKLFDGLLYGRYTSKKLEAEERDRQNQKTTTLVHYEKLGLITTKTSRAYHQEDDYDDSYESFSSDEDPFRAPFRAPFDDEDSYSY